MSKTENDIARTPASPAAGDPWEQNSAGELTTVLINAGFGKLVTLLQDGTPLSERQITRRLNVSRSEAKRLLDGARKALTDVGIELPRPEAPKPIVKPAVRKPAKPIERPKLPGPDAEKLICAKPALLAPATPAALMLIGELLLETARHDPDRAGAMLTRYASHDSSRILIATASKSASRSG